MRLRSIRTRCCAGRRKAREASPRCKTRVSRSSHSVLIHRIIQSGKASLIESTPLFGTTTTTTTGAAARGRKARRKGTRKGRKAIPCARACRQGRRRETLYRGVIIKVTRTPLNGSRLDHRQAEATPPSDTKGCAKSRPRVSRWI